MDIRGDIDLVGKSMRINPGVVVDDLPNGVGVTVEVGEVAMEQSTGLRIFRFLQPAFAS